MPHVRHESLGRIAQIDPRDHAFLLPRPAKLSAAKTKTWTSKGSPIWDQGQTSRCVSFGTNRYLIAKPVQNKVWHSSEGNLDNELTLFYNECQKVDGIQMPHEGSTVRAAMKVLQAAGYITAYRWAFDSATVVQQLLTKGPMVLGTDWTNRMFDPDPHSHFVSVTDGQSYEPVGGHCYLADGVDTLAHCPDGTKGCIWFTNSWGAEWGLGGRARMSLKDLSLLLNNQGEAAIADEHLVK